MSTSNGDPPKRVLGTGYVTAPAECFATEPTTGVYLDTPGPTSAYTVTKRGNKRLRIDDDKTTIYGTFVADGFTPTNPLALPDGSASAPALYFNSSHNTGIYKGTSSGVSISSSGVPAFDFNTSYTHSILPIRLPSGILSNPALQFNISTNSGLHFTATPVMSVDTVVGGTLATSTTSTQFLGLNGSASAPSFSFLTDTGSGLYTTTVGTLAVSAGSTDAMEFTSTGIDCKVPVFSSNQIALKNDGLPTNPQLTFDSAPQSGLFMDIGGMGVCYNGTPAIIFGSAIQAYVPFSCGTNSMSCGSLTASKISYTLYNIRVSLTNPFAVSAGVHTDIIWDTLDSSTNWVTTIPGTPTATFTIPATGLYSAVYTIEGAISSGTKFTYININGGSRRWANVTNIDTNAWGKSGSMIYQFTAGDTVTMRVFLSTAASITGAAPSIMSQFSLNRISD